jgi:hypothetical protein
VQGIVAGRQERGVTMRAAVDGRDDGESSRRHVATP